jgi:hypothetical protein
MCGTGWRKKGDLERSPGKPVLDMARFIQLVRSTLAGQQQQFAEHPAADLLSAFAEQSLSVAERAGVLSHVAKCGKCREILALSSPRLEEASFVAQAPRRALQAYWRWVAAAVVPLLVLVFFWRRSPASNPVVPMAAKTSPPMSLSTTPRPKPVLPARAMPNARKKVPNLPLSVRAVAPPKLAEPLPPSLAVPSQSSQQVQSILPLEPPKLPQPQFLIARSQSSNFRATAALPALSHGFVSASGAIAARESIWALVDQSDTKGVIEKSGDGGKTWQRVHVDDSSEFTALWSRGPEIWVGGEDGALFHSVDAGVTWTPVAVASQDSRLTETITRIDSSASGAVTLRIQSGGNWVTIDGGAHWSRR